MADALLFFDRALLPSGWSRDVRVTVRGGRIATIAENAVPAGAERHACALPGLCNLHSHAFQRGMAGLAERRGDTRDSFWTWRETMYRFVDRLDPDALHAIAALAYVEMLESGFTRVGEFHYLHHDRDGVPFADPAEMCAAIARASGETGIGLTLLPVLYAHGGFGAAPTDPRQRRFVLDIDGYAALLDGAQAALAGLPDALLGIAPHSLRAVTPEQLCDAIRLAAGRPIHIHVAEQVREVEDCIAWSGRRPVEWLFDHADPDGSWCLIHATHVTDAEVAAMIGRGVIAGLCPITEANLGDGLFPAAAFVAGGGRYGIGTDSNVAIDAAGELRLLEYGQRLAERERNVLAGTDGGSTGEALYRAAAEGGAAALGFGGAIATGNAADLVTLDLDHASFAGRTDDDILDRYLFSAGVAAVDCVWRHGVRVVTGGRHHRRDEALYAYRRAVTSLLGT